MSLGSQEFPSSHRPHPLPQGPGWAPDTSPWQLESNHGIENQHGRRAGNHHYQCQPLSQTMSLEVRVSTSILPMRKLELKEVKLPRGWGGQD